ncbi:MAG: ABC transporter permease [Ferruginibacter sp.]
MIKNYLKVALRNLTRSKGYSAINIGGLAVGMSVAMLIGLWVWDEISFDKYHKNFNHIAQAWQFVSFGPEKSSYNSVPVPLAEELRSKYAEVKSASVATFNRDAILTNGDKKLSRTGMYTEPDFPAMMTIKMLAGSRAGLRNVHSMMVSESLAKALFDYENPIDKVVRINNKTDVIVKGVYEDFPTNSSFRDVFFLAPWQLYTTMDDYAKSVLHEWDENSFQVFVQLQEGADVNKVSAKIKDTRMKMGDPPAYKPEFFLHPMSRWHLYGEFKNGVNTGGLIKLVKLFGIAGVFVLLLACINFMNLSTARSEKRAKEVGIRKTLGSMKGQLIRQFLTESLLVSFIALFGSLLIVQLLLPFFNQVANKDLFILWTNPVFWLVAFPFSLLTGVIAGSYPALYLSSLRPVKVLKGSFKAGRLAPLPRKILVVFQFSISVALIAGTLIWSRQINHAKDRPIGYDSNGLMEININIPELAGHYDAIRSDLLNTSVVAEASGSLGSITADYGGTTNISWKGKTANMHPLLMSNRVTHDYGKTIGWNILQGRDFSKKFLTDSSAIVLNESAVQVMGLQNPVNETVRLSGKDYRVIGVIGNVIKDSPFQPVKPSVFTIGYKAVNVYNIKLSPHSSVTTALAKIEEVFKKYNPQAPFNYKFVDEQYAQKFATEERIGKLGGFFAILAIFISCLGLFGLASFVAGQRTKEIGIRKVLGATVPGIWQLLSKEFLLLVLISLLIALPLAYYFMNKWLQNYEYRTEISWWVFGIVALGALLLTVLTVSFQAIKAAIANPVTSLRTE